MWQQIADNAAPFLAESTTEWVRLPCPFCENETNTTDYKRNLQLNRVSYWYNCFRCSNHGRLPRRYLQDFDDYSADFAPEVTEKKQPHKADGYEKLYAGNLNPRYDWARTYLEQTRGLPQNVLADAHVGAANTGRLRGRIIVPFPNYETPTAPWLGWISRSVATKSYLNAKNMDRSLLYNHPALWVETTAPVFVVEGVFDAMALWPNAVAVLGKPLPKQIAALSRAPRPVVVVLDGDAWQEGWMLALSLRIKGQRAGAIRLPPKKDPDEIPLALLEFAGMNALDAATGCVTV